MRALIALALAAWIVVVPARAQEQAQAIQDVIVSQLEALSVNDLEAAYSHASPMIQSMFPTPEVFGRMVREGYPMIWRPSRYQMQGLLQTGRGPVQAVLIEDGVGRQFEAFYEMVPLNGVWRINGVYLRELPGVGS